MNQLKYCYAVKHNNENVRAGSRSGGVFTAVSDIVLSDGGAVYGCVMTEDFRQAKHIRAVTAEDRNRMRGSKYVQSVMGNCYSLCADDLKNGMLVLFTGTPCQIEALNCFLSAKNINTEKLITMDIVCHSVVSPKVWEKYINWFSDGRHVDSVDFRDKKQFGWTAHYETIVTDGKAESSNNYAKLFYRNVAYPLHCFSCYFKTTDRVSDITIGDYWGIDIIDPDFYDDKGTSLVMLNTSKGENYFFSCKDSLIYTKHLLCDSMQPPFDHNYHIPKNRKRFFKDLDKLDFSELIKKYVNPKKTFSYSLINKIAALFKR